MSKLDEILKKHSYQTKLLESVDSSNIVDREAKSNIRLVILDIFSESLNESQSVSDIYRSFIKKLEQL